LHPSLTFTSEMEQNGKIAFLDMEIIHTGLELSSTWYVKPTDTGLIMNYHALSPKRYKRFGSKAESKVLKLSLI